MMEQVLDWLQHHEGPLAYLVVAASSMIEYVFPPMPGDTVALFAVFLATTAGYRIGWVYVALNVGALAGAMLAYSVGRAFATRRDDPPRFLRSKAARDAIEATLARFERHGAAYLVVNRFVPALRSFFFVAAGMLKLPAWKVALYGTISAMLWNGMLLGLGYLIGTELDRMQTIVSQYSIAASVITALVVGGLALRWVLRRRRARAEDGRGP
ncbi:MAG: DedA family protein [Sandaracinaceae bacterium]